MYAHYEGAVRQYLEAYNANTDEYKKYNTTEGGHETLIRLSRASVVFIITSITILVYFVGNISYIFLKGKLNDFAHLTMEITCNLIQGTADIIWSLTLYFPDEFAHEAYRKCCASCDDRMGRYCKRRYNIQVSQHSSKHYT